MRARQQWLGTAILPNLPHRAVLFSKEKKKKWRKWSFFFFYKIRFWECWHVDWNPSTWGRSWVKFLTLGLRAWGRKLLFRLPHLINVFPRTDEVSVCHGTCLGSACKPAGQSSGVAGPISKFYYTFYTKLLTRIRSVAVCRGVDPRPATRADDSSQGQRRRRWRRVSAGQADKCSGCCTLHRSLSKSSTGDRRHDLHVIQKRLQLWWRQYKSINTGCDIWSSLSSHPRHWQLIFKFMTAQRGEKGPEKRLILCIPEYAT